MATRTSSRRRRRTTQRHDGDICHICNYRFPSPALYDPPKYEAIVLRHIAACSKKNDPQPPETVSVCLPIDEKVAAPPIIQLPPPIKEEPHPDTCTPQKPMCAEVAAGPILVSKEDRPQLSECYRNTSDMTADTTDDQTTAPSNGTPDLISSASDFDTISSHAPLPGGGEGGGSSPSGSARPSQQSSSARSDYAQCPICSKVFVPPKGYMFDPDAFELKLVNHVTRCSKNPSPKALPTKSRVTKSTKAAKKKRDGAKTKGKKHRGRRDVIPSESATVDAPKRKSSRDGAKPSVAKRKRALSPVSIDPGHLLAKTWWKKTRAPPTKKEVRPRREEVKFDLQACVVAAMEENADDLEQSRRSGRKATEQELQFACPICRQPFKSSYLGPVTEEAMKRHVIRCQSRNESVSLADGEGDGRENTSIGVPIEKRIRRELSNEERAHMAAGHALRASSLVPYIVGDCQDALDNVFCDEE